MDDKDKILAKDSTLVVVEAVVDEVAKSIPGINIVWGLSKVFHEARMKLRQEKALEWVEMIRDNPLYFTGKILSDEKFQDGFVVALEKYLLERNKDKRTYFRNIFLGFVQADDKDKFPLEKFIHTLSQLGEMDIEVLRDVKVDEQGANYRIYPVNNERVEYIYNLIGQGLLIDTTGNRIGYPQDTPFVKASSFGKDFIKFIKES